MNIMPASLHERASTTYYGQWPWEKAAVRCLESPAIAHNELVAGAGFGAFDARERDFPTNRGPARRKFVFRSKQNVRARRRGPLGLPYLIADSTCFVTS